MDSSAQKSKANARNPKDPIYIGGIPVEFPHQPYGSQLAFMGRVISTLVRAQKDGHCHALLESPTGTGKSLSLLCSALAWQQNQKAKNLAAQADQSKPNPEALNDPLNYGGGFIPEAEPSQNPGPAPSETGGKSKKKKMAPTIFYASRTHSQITQVIREYRKTSYRVPMAVLGSRKLYCTNPKVCSKANVDEECKLLLKTKNQDVGCLEFKNYHRVRNHPSLQKGGCHEAHDIEDLVKIGQIVKGCSYYAAVYMAEDAQLVFCPYNYIINPVIRGAVELDIKGAIVIFDEAHNIEDVARDAGSIDVDEDSLFKLQTELGELCLADATTYQPLYEMTEDILSWIGRRKEQLENHDFQHHFSCWTGEKAKTELQKANISMQSFPILKECAAQAIKAATDTESIGNHLSGMSVILLEELFCSLSYFFHGNGLYINDYQLALQRYIKRDPGHTVGAWTYTLCLWCLNPSVVFRDISNLSFSVILTSGTLSPLTSFSSELGVQFETSLEAPHVIDVGSQVWSTVISTSPSNYPLNASYRTADVYAFQDALGITLEEILKIVPGGCLIFFPSYKLMEKLCSRWRGTGQWAQLNALKTLFVEPRGGSQDEFEPILKDYYETICQADKPTFGRKRRGKQMGLTMSQSTELPVTSKRTGGAAFLAVCRGKVSEGIDFSDENARAVIIVGIPFPNINDIKVSQKKKYNDTYKLSRSLLSGSQWYCQQAFRALNQAAGRCIRHRFDYGAIILLDERYKEERNVAYVSKWLRNALRQYDRFDAALLELQSFFGNAEEKYGKRSVSIQNIDIDVENISSIVQKKGVVKKKQLRSNSLDGYWRVVSKQEETEKSTSFSQCLTLDQKDHASISQLKTQSDVEAKAEDTVSCKEIIGSEYSFKNKPRCTEVVSVSSSYEDPDVSVVKETPDVDDGASMISFEAPRDDYSSSTVILCSSELPVQSFDSIPLTLSSAPSDEKWSSPDTPKGNISEITSSLIPEKELSLNRSVNSHTQKRRRSISSLSTKLTQEEQVDDPDIQIPQGVRVIESSMVENQRIQYVSNNQSTETKLNKKIVTNSPGMGTSPDETSGPVHSERLRIFCSICSSPLGLPANNFYMSCSLTSSSKVHLASLAKENVESSVDTSDTCILITDVSSVDQQLWNRSVEGDPLQSTWCEKDGCVFRTVFCPFCKTTDSCLGVQIMAADASNVRLLNKILFYLDHLEIKNFEPTITKPKDISPVASSDTERVAVLQYIDKFAYSPPPQQNSRGWRTKKSKLKLPRRGLLSDSRANG